MSPDNSPLQTTADASDQLPGKVSIFDSLRNRNYRWFWTGTIAFFIGMQMQSLAQSWLAYQLTHSPFKLGIVSAAWGLPMFVVSPFSGVIIDRVQKRNLLIINQACLGLVMLVLAVLVSTGTIQYWHLVITSLLGGVTAAFTMPTRQSILPELVPKNRVYNAVALYSGGTNLTQIAGPALAGALIGLIGIGGVYYCALACQVIAIGSLSRLPATSQQRTGVRGSAFKDMLDGLRYFKNHEIILMLLLMQFVIALLGMPLQNLMPVFAEKLNVQAQGYGLLMTMSGIGALVGSLGVASLGNYKKKGRLMLGAGLISGIMLIFFANTPYLGTTLHMGGYVFYLASGILLVAGMSNSAYATTSTTAIMMNVKDEFRGRTMSIYTIVMGLMPLGVMLAGAIAEARGVAFTVTVCGSILTAFMLVMAFFNRRIRNVE